MFDTFVCLIRAVVSTRQSHSHAGATLSLRERKRKLWYVRESGCLQFSAFHFLPWRSLVEGFFLELSLCHIGTVFTERTALLNPTRELKESWVLLSLFLVCHNLNVIWNVSLYFVSYVRTCICHKVPLTGIPSLSSLIEGTASKLPIWVVFLLYFCELVKIEVLA